MLYTTKFVPIPKLPLEQVDDVKTLLEERHIRERVAIFENEALCTR